MKMMSLFGNVIIRAALVPVLLVLLMCQGAMKLVVSRQLIIRKEYLS